jgi:helix-turn-helix protein
MTNRKAIWKLAPTASAAIVRNIGPIIQATVQESPFKDVPRWFVIGTAFYIRPEPLTVKRLRVRNPYNNPETQENAIKALTEAGLLDEKGVITQTAVNAYQKLIDAQDTEADRFDNMEQEDLKRVGAYLKRAYEAAHTVTEPPIPCLKDASRLDMRGGAVHQVFYTVGRLNAFRDDCHLAAWKHLEVDGNTYEAFSLVWDGTADSAATLLEARQNRGYEETDWQAALDKLVKKGWLEKDGESYKASDEGNKIREKIEDKTDDYFYQPFDILSDEEVDNFLTLLKEVEEKFTPEAQVEA